MTSDESHRLQLLAYRFWEEEGRPEGRAEEHWHRAQRQLRIEFCVGFRDNCDPPSTVLDEDRERISVTGRSADSAAG